MASGSGKSSSRFSTFKVFKFAGSKAPPPPPPPKDTNYLYSASNPSVLSFSNQSLSVDAYSQPPTPHSTRTRPPFGNVRSPSPAPSRATTQSQSPALLSSGLSPETAGFRKNLFKIASFGKRSRSRSSRAMPAEDDESISLPWNFQHNIHVDESLGGIPPSWTQSLLEAGFTEAEIEAIHEARRTRSPASARSNLGPSISRSHSPVPSSVLVNPRPRSSSLSRKRSDQSLARSERSARRAELPPPLPSHSHIRQYSISSHTSSARDPDVSYTEVDGTESIAAHSDMQYVYVDHNTRPPNRSTPTTPSCVPSTSRSTRSTPEDTRSRPRTPPRRVYRVVNETTPVRDHSPPPAYASPIKGGFNGDANGDAPPPVTAADLARPPPQEKSDEATGTGAHQEEEDGEEEEEDGEGATEMDHPDQSRTSTERHRPPRLSMLPPRLSLRKDAIDDVASWTEALLSSIPSAITESPEPTPRTPGFTPPPQNAKKASLKAIPKVVPNILLTSASPARGNDEISGETEQEIDYSLSASPLYHELMGMMQDNGPSPSTSSSSANSDTLVFPRTPPSPGFPAQVDPDRSSARDSSLTIRLDPRRNSDRDSSASASTITHATIVRGGTVVRRAPVNVVISPALDRGEGRKGGALVEEAEEEGEATLELDVPPSLSAETDVTPRHSPHGRSPSPAGSSSSSEYSDSGSGFGGPSSPRQTIATTSGSNSAEDGAQRSPLPSPSPNQTQFSQQDRVPKPSIVISTDVAPQPEPVYPSATSMSTLQSLGVFSPTHSMTPNSAATFASLHASRYPGWLSHVVEPLSDFIDSSLDPRDLFADLQEIAEGESGSVFAARVLAPPPSHRFVPPTPTSPFRGSPARQQAHDMVAIKAIPIAPVGSPKLLDLRKELELMRDVRHPNVLKMEGVYVDLVEDSLWIGMELMERSLADVLGIRGDEDGEEVVVGEKMVARFVWDVLLALSYLRKQRIAHRDLRSDNLLLSKDGVLKLADFSSAVRAVPNTKCSDVVGVIYWQAPEVRKGRYDPLKVDVWSLGATTWELVHGEPPFADVQDPRLIGSTLPPVADSEIYSRSFHDFLHLCSQPVASRPDPDELLNAHFIRTACPRSAIVHLLGQCRAVEERILRRQSVDSQGTFTMP